MIAQGLRISTGPLAAQRKGDGGCTRIGDSSGHQASRHTAFRDRFRAATPPERGSSSSPYAARVPGDSKFWIHEGDRNDKTDELSSGYSPAFYAARY